MQEEAKNRKGCQEFEGRLFDLLDGAIEGAELEEFKAHAAACEGCGPMFEQVSAGRDWLRGLEEVEPPTRLVHNILAKTSLAEKPRLAQDGEFAPGDGGGWPAKLRHGWGLRVAGMMHPRFAMTAAMSFFSLSLIYNLSGMSLRDVRHLDLRPAAITTEASLSYHEMTARMVKYYDNVRFVYEFQARLSELKKAAATDERPSEGQTPQGSGERREQKRPEDKKDNNSTKKNRSPRSSQPAQDGTYSVAPAADEWAKLQIQWNTGGLPGQSAQDGGQA